MMRVHFRLSEYHAQGQNEENPQNDVTAFFGNFHSVHYSSLHLQQMESPQLLSRTSLLISSKLFK
jgi:hypothetical protein